MIVDPNAAKLFISGYKSLLGEVYRLSGVDRGLELYHMLDAARDAAVADPSLIDRAASILESAGRAVPEEVLTAIQSMMVRRWVFLRDTTKYSVFIEPDGSDAYAVLGLTQPLRDIVGGTGCLVRAGVVYFRGAYVCDGIVSGNVWIGGNYRREYSTILASLKKAGHFHVG